MRTVFIVTIAFVACGLTYMIIMGVLQR